MNLFEVESQSSENAAAWPGCNGVLKSARISSENAIQTKNKMDCQIRWIGFLIQINAIKVKSMDLIKRIKLV